MGWKAAVRISEHKAVSVLLLKSMDTGIFGLIAHAIGVDDHLNESYRCDLIMFVYSLKSMFYFPRDAAVTGMLISLESQGKLLSE